VTIGPEVDLAINTFGFGSPFGNGTLNGMQLSKVQLFLAMELDGGAPFSLPAGRATPLVVRIDPRDELIARPPQLVWRFASGSGAFTRVPLVALGGELWTAELPAGACGQVVEYFVSTAGSASGHRTLPNGAPEALFRAPVGTHGIEPRLSADFEAGLPDEWSADGLWHVTSACAPAPSCDGGAFAYFGIDGQCDYDAGFEAKGALSTPLVDLATKLENARATLRFCYEKEGMDEFLGTASVWVEGTLVAELPHQPFEWAEAEIDLTKFLGQAVTIEFRFDANHPAAGNARGFFVDGVSVVVEGTTCGDAHEGLPQLGVGAEALLK
jgi:hypothetical protein